MALGQCTDSLLVLAPRQQPSHKLAYLTLGLRGQAQGRVSVSNSPHRLHPLVLTIRGSWGMVLETEE